MMGKIAIGGYQIILKEGHNALVQVFVALIGQQGDCTCRHVVRTVYIIIVLQTYVE